MEKGARRAHSCIRETPASVKVCEPGPPAEGLGRASLVTQMSAEKHKWSEAWQANNHPGPAEVWPLPVPVKKAVEATALRNICRRFSRNTCKPDGWHP
eukprot:7554382-Pyramimonas_sp.AAC.1